MSGGFYSLPAREAAKLITNAVSGGNRAAKMASSSPTTTADTLINLKVNLDGATRRFKLPLRDLGANVFEDKLRAFLQIPVDTATVIERYSDSAASFVTLHQSNTAIYKQLYRAAKAKQKLKLRVTTKPIEPVKEVKVPKPVTIEDEPEDELPKETEQDTPTEPEKEIQKESVEPTANEPPTETADTVIAPQTVQDFPLFVKQWRARGMPRIHLRRDAKDVEVVDFLGPSAAAEPFFTQESSDGSAPSRFTQSASPITFANLMREACERGMAAAMVKEATLKELKAKETILKGIKTNEALVKEAMAKAALVREALAKSAARSRIVEPIESSAPTTPQAVEQKEEAQKAEVACLPECLKRPFTVCCNSCDQAVPDAHFHCSICDDGDFDLCQDCVNRGISCYGDGHWLIKRTIVNGQIKCSSTHIAPKSVRPTAIKSTPSPSVPTTFNIPTCLPAVLPPSSDWSSDYNARTCNCCVQEFREEEFVHCTTCDDYDLCKGCIAKDQHGHHPKHGFTAAVKGTIFESSVSSRLAPGRNCLHNAICDGCDKYVRGIRHKCLDCPDWDYCSDCVKDAGFIHPNHRFVAIYEPLADRPFRTSSARATHFGICCDGPLCSSREGGSRYIVGERYKCAVCHDTDFCANCEASPANTHNKTHPLIKFKTPVRHVSVTTTGEHEDGQRLPTMGDRVHRSRTGTQSIETQASPRESIAATPVQTVVNVQPTEQPATLPPSQHVEVKKEDPEPQTSSVSSVEPRKESSVSNDLVAIFKWDTVKDGSVLPPNHTFEQTWVLRNEGSVPWPAGCSVKFVGGDYMGAVDPTHPAGIHELVSASESTVCYDTLNPGQEFPFTVLMRTPDREGKVISYWRLTTRDGAKFGHKLWCDVTVQTPPKVEQIITLAPVVAQSEVQKEGPAMVSESHMIIPKLEHESPSASIHGSQSEVAVETETETLAPSIEDDDDDFEDCGGQDDWAEESDNGFLTDEEYDILDASDEEFLSEQQKMLSRK
ncbi:hypothetical protein F5Y19DRAFT_474950 [Xylariaceae sp. FL1651]|nr:hypothetical protein F5Y19DRAFT_474950 [Xylariaceae sp. FL1651]